MLENSCCDAAMAPTVKCCATLCHTPNQPAVDTLPSSAHLLPARPPAHRLPTHLQLQRLDVHDPQKRCRGAKTKGAQRGPNRRQGPAGSARIGGGMGGGSPAATGATSRGKCACGWTHPSVNAFLHNTQAVALTLQRQPDQPAEQDGHAPPLRPLKKRRRCRHCRREVGRAWQRQQAVRHNERNAVRLQGPVGR